MISKKAQTSVYVIIAIVIVVALVLFFVLRDRSGGDDIPEELSPVFEYYQTCIEQEAATAVELAGIQGGRVDTGVYIPGSEYAPFSSQLNFLGSPVPYWYYISGNGLIKEEVPTKSDMEREIADYIAEGLRGCDFENYFRQGFIVNVGEPTVNVQVSDNKVSVEVSAELAASRDEVNARKVTHTLEINSKLGKFYDLATEIYDEEKDKAFLEDYAIDVLYNYAPVDGVEIQCAPKIWATQNVVNELKTGLEQNFQTLKFQGNYYDIQDEKREYFIIDKSVDEAVNVLYFDDWPTKIEVFGEGADDDILMAKAVGAEQGLGIIGFCYVPYHFVYDVSFPVMIQIYDGDELFQFPFVVVVDNNKPRQAVFDDLGFEEATFDLCEYKTQQVSINLYDVNLNPTDANITYECFNQQCRLGESENGVLRTVAPACSNGYLNIRTEGYAQKKQLFSTNDEFVADVILEREHELNISLFIAGRGLDGTAVVSFAKEDGATVSTALPDFGQIKLSEGAYEIQVYVYGNSSIVLPASTRSECVEVPKPGLLGFFGSTKEECFDINIPETKIDYALIGGGSLNTYLLESELEKGHIRLNVERLPTPRSVEDMANNFELFKDKRVGVEFDED